MLGWPVNNPFSNRDTSVADGMFHSETLTVSGRATLALTRDGPVLGLPSDCTFEAATEAREGLERWWQAVPFGGPLVLPWPVDVTELRAVS